MGLTTYYTATSLDGFIADGQQSLEWLLFQREFGMTPCAISGDVDLANALREGSQPFLSWQPDGVSPGRSGER